VPGVRAAVGGAREGGPPADLLDWLGRRGRAAPIGAGGTASGAAAVTQGGGRISR
jgi:hypothetical protein